jgi:hypothetical protein
MRRFLLGLVFLNLLGALVGAVVTWPKSATDPERTSPTLAEFQTGVRIAVASDTTTQSSDAPAARSERMQRGDTRVAMSLTQAVGEAGRELDSGWDPIGQPYRVASNQSLQEMFSAGENVPEASMPSMPRLAWPHATPDVPRQKDRPAEPVVLASTEPEQTTIPAVLDRAEPGTPTELTKRVVIADAPQHGDLSTESPVVAVEVEKLHPQTSNEPDTDVSRPTLITGRHVGRIAIHYHSDTRSRTDAQRISSRLGSAGLNTVEMHTTAHVIPASLVRYFSRQDALAAIALAKGLGSKATDWHVDDCTAYQHKPERGTIQLWPAAVATSR